MDPKYLPTTKRKTSTGLPPLNEELRTLKEMISDRNDTLRRLSLQQRQDNSKTLAPLDIIDFFKDTLDDIRYDMKDESDQIDFDELLNEQQLIVPEIEALSDQYQHKISRLNEQMSRKNSEMRREKLAIIRKEQAKSPKMNVANLFEQILDDINSAADVTDNFDQINLDQILNEQKKIVDLVQITTAAHESEEKVETLEALDAERIEELEDDIQRFKKIISNRNRKLASLKRELSDIRNAVSTGDNDVVVDKLQHRLSRKKEQVGKLRRLVDEMLQDDKLRDKRKYRKLVERYKKVISNRNHKLAAMKKEMMEMYNHQNIDNELEQELQAKNKQIAEYEYLLDEYKKMQDFEQLNMEDKLNEIALLQATVAELEVKLKQKEDLINEEKIWFNENEDKLRRLSVIGDKQMEKTSYKGGLLWLLVTIIAGLTVAIVYMNVYNPDYVKQLRQLKQQNSENEAQHRNLRMFDSWTKFAEMTGLQNDHQSTKTEINTHNDQKVSVQDEEQDTDTDVDEIDLDQEVIDDVIEEPSSKTDELRQPTRQKLVDSLNKIVGANGVHSTPEPIKEEQSFWTRFGEMFGSQSMPEPEPIVEQNEEQSFVIPIMTGTSAAIIMYVLWKKGIQIPHYTLMNDAHKKWRRNSDGRLSSSFNYDHFRLEKVD